MTLVVRALKGVLWVVVGVLGLSTCQKKAPASSYNYLEGDAQGTTFHITYKDSLGRDFSGSIDSLFRVLDRSMSLWDSTSVIRRINNHEPGVLPDAHFLAVFRRSQEISQLTNGAFDATVAPLVRAWGFSFKKQSAPPEPSQVDSLRQQVGYLKARVVAGRVVFDDPRMEVDFNAIAQGYTVDVLADFLIEKGVRHFLVEVGGEVRAQGRNERGEVWRVGIDKPVAGETPGRPLQAVVRLDGRSLATSGNYRKFIERDGKRYSHSIDPQTGYPVTHTLLSVSVLADDCMSADAFATAFLVMGTDRAFALAEQLKLPIACIYENAPGQLTFRASPDFEPWMIEPE
ncbi:FAD:protein FMN transferase [Rhabdobacter roseus]|uniref:FAD:protein FMN transferase n=1 Tax=Rhabdobacter roseus TaxID=1655419 RepID=A0A840TNR2_9BACT|nr:FAD:protein FMN transferase [Rhabdobacter roseus]MBB5285351.1 thiamine biosynthesis lipoprotein [Rhabdobacter roseus]